MERIDLSRAYVRSCESGELVGHASVVELVEASPACACGEPECSECASTDYTARVFYQARRDSGPVVCGIYRETGTWHPEAGINVHTSEIEHPED